MQVDRSDTHQPFALYSGIDGVRGSRDLRAFHLDCGSASVSGTRVLSWRHQR